MEHQQKMEMIEAYLAGRLIGEELKDFEVQLQNDESLQKEVGIHQDLSNVLKDGPDHAFWEHISGLRKKYSDTPGSNDSSSDGTPFWRIRWFLGFAIIICAGGLLYFFSQMLTNENLPSEPMNAIEQQDVMEPESNEEEATLPLEEGNEEAPEENSNEVIEEIPPKAVEKPSPPSNKTRPIASAFEPNPTLEKLLLNQLRGDFTFKIDHPKPDAQLSTQIGRTNFSLSGKLETSKIAEADFSLIVEIYSNKEEDYKKERPVISLPIELTETDEAYLFDFETSLEIESGLYYYLILDDYSRAILFGRRLMVDG